MQEENQRSRPRFQPPAQQKPAPASPKAPVNTYRETAKVCLCVYSMCYVLAIQMLYSYTKFTCIYVVFCQATERDEAASMKDWILRYAEQSSEDEEEEEEEERGKKTNNPELDEKFDPVS